MLFRTLNPDDEFPRPSPNFIMSFLFSERRCIRFKQNPGKFSRACHEYLALEITFIANELSNGGLNQLAKPLRRISRVSKSGIRFYS